MKRFIIFITFIFGTIYGFSQSRFEIKNATSNIKPLYSVKDSSKLDTVHMNLTLRGRYDTIEPSNNTVNFDVQYFNLPVHPRLVNSSMTFPATCWPGNFEPPEDSYDTTIIISILSGNLKDTLKNDEIGHIIIKDIPNKFHTIRFTNSLFKEEYKYNKNKPFWIEIGSNFDLIDGLEPNNFFSGVFFYKRDIRPIFQKKSDRKKNKYIAIESRPNAEKNLAVFAGIYESKSITNTQEQNYSFRNYYDSTSFLTNVNDSFKIFKGIGQYTNMQVVQNVSLFYSPQVRLTNWPSNEDGFHLFLSLWLELQWQKITEDRSFNHLKKLDSFNIDINALQDYDPQQFSKVTDIRSHYLGVGLPVFYRQTLDDDPVFLFLNPVTGLSNQPMSSSTESLKLDQSGNLIDRKWLPFYFVQFRLNEEKYGISFTGEVKGLIQKNTPPFVTIALTKKFDLTKFMEFSK